ncbi:recombinase family protein [Streptomyces sp. NBC_01241]|uniref:recombinase family protein n=1 Tax=Streptomyces sp. NBC_01241 TaxID=2903794 RepID=UPI00352CACB0|nr:recombinase family protein [Streptomyces sp. NBC_01241]
MGDTRPLAGYLRMSDADLAEIKNLVKIGALTPEEAKERERKGVLKQKEDVIQLADRLLPGQPVVFYEDNNLSAFKRNVKRKKFEEMLKDMGVGSLGGVLAYDIDRLFRQPKDLERLIDHYEKPNSGLVFHTLSGQNFDLTTGDGRFSARIMVSVANKSSEDMSRRLKREMERMAYAGEMAGGPRPFGWEDDRLTLRPKEKKALDDMAEKVLKGDSVTTVMDWLRDQGFVGRTGKPFVRSSVQRILLNPRNAGIRQFRGEPLKDEEGNYVKGPWKAPWTVDKWLAVKKTLEGPGANRTKVGPGHNTVRSILSGILRCGVCGTRMVAANSSRKYPKYRCAKDAGGCGNITISRKHSEDAVRGLVSDVLMAATAQKETEEVGPKWEKAAELAALEKEFAEFHQLWKADKIKTTSYILGREKLEGEIDQLRGERAVALARPTKPPSLEVIKGGWDKLSIERQREVILSVLSAVMVSTGKGTAGGKVTRGIDHSRLTPVFKEQ